jgi:predicted negative regulator of RcsB-dependent stress response
MSDIKQDERGFSPVETILVIVIVAVIGFVGWYIYHAKQNTDKSLGAANATSNNVGPRFTSKSKQTATANAGDTSNASLQSDLQAASSSSNQGSKDLAASNDSLNDKSTMTTVPQ